MDRLPVSSSACKELRNHHSILTISKKAEQIFKTNNSSWVLEKGKGEAMASGHGETDMASSPEEMPGPRPLQEPALVVEVRTVPVDKDPTYFETYHEELKEVVAVHLPEKSLQFRQGEENGNILNTPEHAVLLNKLYPQVKLVNQSFTCWGLVRAQLSERIYRTPVSSSHPVPAKGRGKRKKTEKHL